jgi:hypothetical protein
MSLNFCHVLRSKTQHFRVTNYYGAQITELLEKEEETSKPETVSPSGIVYAESDGSMILTREKKDAHSSNNCWEEVKLLRLYKSEHKLENFQRNVIEQSEYVAHLGCHEEFETKAEQVPDRYEHTGKNLVFISDGAIRIHKRQTEMYPNATQILDYYHACEHLAEFAKIVIQDDSFRRIWLDSRKEELLESQVEKVLKRILIY